MNGRHPFHPSANNVFGKVGTPLSTLPNLVFSERWEPLPKNPSAAYPLKGVGDGTPRGALPLGGKA